MIMAVNDYTIASKHPSCNAFYWGCMRFIFTDYDEDSIESLCPVEIFKTDDSQKINIWRPEKHSLRVTIHNTSEKKTAILIQQEFSDGRGYELDETVDLISGDSIDFRQFRENSTLRISIIDGDRVCCDGNVLFFSVKTRYSIV